MEENETYAFTYKKELISIYSKTEADKIFLKRDEAIAIINGNFALITGSLTIKGFEEKNVYIDFPEGFNKDNSVVISIGTRFGSEAGFVYGNNDEPTNDINPTRRAYAIFGYYTDGNNKDKIRFYGYKPGESGSDEYDFKIVLMKVPIKLD